jgi:cobaltochelatase CobN
MGREMRSRYLNPKWIEAMLKEGYAGARMIRQVADNLWGWQVTVPEAVDGAKWQEMFEAYVQDHYGLGVRDKFRAAENLAAYQAVVERMLAAIDKGYWQAAPGTVARLHQAQADLAPAVTMENETIAKRAEAHLGPAPALANLAKTTSSTAQAAGSKPPATELVQGRVLEEKPRAESRAPAVTAVWSPHVFGVWLVAVGLVALGWWRQGNG